VRVLALLCTLLAAAAPPKIAVLDVRTGPGVDPSLGPYLAQVLAQEVADRTGTAPLVSADVTAMLGFERNKRMLGCSEEDSQCLAEITGALGVQEVLATSVALSGGKYLVALSLLDARRARPLKRTAQSVPVDHEALVLLVRRSAWEIFGGAPPQGLAPAAPAAVTAAGPASWSGPSRRTWALIAEGGAVALAGAGAIVGARALSAARDGNSGTARPRAHLADILFGSAALAAGAGAYLWFSAAPAPGGAAVTAGGAW
jgi:hypothetical protein